MFAALALRIGNSTFCAKDKILSFRSAAARAKSATPLPGKKTGRTFRSGLARKDCLPN
jgi:hypothetical protein